MRRGNATDSATRPLPALLSQVLVAFTIELDTQFELRMKEAGHPGARLSLVIWSNLLRFLPEGGASVQSLAAQSSLPSGRVKFELGCLERWRVVTFAADRPIAARFHRQAGRVLRDGWGSARGIRADWVVNLTARGRAACNIWPALLPEIERRWQTRFGAQQIVRLHKSLQTISPEGPPVDLSALLSKVLSAFTEEFDAASRVPLWLCANTLRILSDSPVPVSQIPHLTGSSPETSGIGWQSKPYVSLLTDHAARRGKLVKLTPAGLKAQAEYYELVAKIEERWKIRYGAKTIVSLHNSLLHLLMARHGTRLLMAEGLVPPPGTVRAGEPSPSLGLKHLSPAALQRARDLVAQTELFLSDPSGTLPHYPLWDMNRGFGP